jgi:hypothetical protein
MSNYDMGDSLQFLEITQSGLLNVFFWGQEFAINQLILRFGVILCKISIRWCHPMTFVLNLQGWCYKFSFRWHYRLQHPSD